jgi:hypothetical protein
MTSIKRAWPTTLTAAVIAGILGGCTPNDASKDPAVTSMIGREYRIIGDVDAYGMKSELPSNDASYITLIPMNISGPEVAFKKRLPKGQTFRIQSARRRFDNGNVC